MTNHQKPFMTNAMLRYQKGFLISHVLALTSTFAIGVQIFILSGWINVFQGGNGKIAYFVAIFVFLPILLTYVELISASRTKSETGFLGLLKKKNSPSLLFFGSWLLILGNLSIIAFLGRSLGHYLNSFFIRTVIENINNVTLFTFSALALSFIIAVLRINKLSSFFTNITFLSIGIALIVLLWITINTNPINLEFVQIGKIENLWSLVALLSPGLWGISIILDYSGKIPRLRKRVSFMLPILFSFGFILGGFVLISYGFPSIWIVDQAIFSISAEFPFASLLKDVLLLSGFFVLIWALIGIISSFSKFFLGLIKESIIPFESFFIDKNHTINWIFYLISFVLCLLMGVFLPFELLIGLSGIGFLWITVILNASEFNRKNKDYRHKKDFHLPFPPLFPGIAIAISCLLSLTLPLSVIISYSIWLGLGFVFYKYYFRKQEFTIRELHTNWIEHIEYSVEIDNDVLAIVQDPYSAIPLIEASANLAMMRTGRLLVMQSLSLPIALPEAYQRQEAQHQINELEEYIRRSEIPVDLLVIPIVDVTDNIESSILDLVDEENIGLVVLNWRQEEQKNALDDIWSVLVDDVSDSSRNKDIGNLDLRKIMCCLPCDVLIFRGEYKGDTDSVIIPVLKNFPLKTIQFGQEITKNSRVPLVVLGTPENDYSLLDDSRKELDVEEDNKRITIEVVGEENIERVILDHAKKQDLVLIGIDLIGVFEKELFDDIVNIFKVGKQKATILYRPSNKAFRFFQYRVWYFLRGLFPTLLSNERTTISAQMREAARPSVDYFVLIALSATIGTLGLLTNSTAVIIGAMLVAPLMSPILSTALGMVQGDIRLIRLASEAALKGIAMAIVVGALISIIFPDPLATDEIFARINPNLLDLAVAFASGAAAGYALSRKNVSAALPGVAIAVSLVPPLCVIGYGIAVSDLQTSGGAFLLFLTNVIAIILAAAIVFMLLGFRPLSERKEQFQRSLLISIISFAIISIPLAYFLINALEKTSQKHIDQLLVLKVENILEEELQKDNAYLLKMDLDCIDEEYFVDATIIVTEDTVNMRIYTYEKILREELDRPIEIQAKVLIAEPLRK